MKLINEEGRRNVASDLKEKLRDENLKFKELEGLYNKLKS